MLNYFLASFATFFFLSPHRAFPSLMWEMLSDMKARGIVLRRQWCSLAPKMMRKNRSLCRNFIYHCGKYEGLESVFVYTCVCGACYESLIDIICTSPWQLIRFVVSEMHIQAAGDKQANKKTSCFFHLPNCSSIYPLTPCITERWTSSLNLVSINAAAFLILSLWPASWKGFYTNIITKNNLYILLMINKLAPPPGEDWIQASALSWPPMVNVVLYDLDMQSPGCKRQVLTKRVARGLSEYLHCPRVGYALQVMRHAHDGRSEVGRSGDVNETRSRLRALPRSSLTIHCIDHG